VLFRSGLSKKFLNFYTVALSFLFDNHKVTTDLQINCVIIFLLSSIFNASYMCCKIRCDGKF